MNRDPILDEQALKERHLWNLKLRRARVTRVKILGLIGELPVRLTRLDHIAHMLSIARVIGFN
jgi:hypothetical protein